MSSSDSDDDVIIAAAALKKIKRNRKKRFWIHPYNLENNPFSSFNIVKDLKDKEKFLTYFRMSKATFKELVNVLEHKLKKKDTNWRCVVSVEEQLASTLRYLATGSNFRALSIYFCRGETTVGAIIKRTCKIIWETLSPKKEEWLRISARFEQLHGMPHCIGSIDGKHVRIKKPRRSGSAFYCYKGFCSIVLMAVVDADGFFISIDVGDIGRNSDGRVFSESNFGKALGATALDIPESSNLNLPENASFENLPYFFVADEAFPLMKNIMRPFPGKKLRSHQELFDDRLSRARKIVECAFGMLVSKFRMFEVPISCHPDQVDIIVKAACVLHNFIRSKDGIISPGAKLTREKDSDKKIKLKTDSPLRTCRQITEEGKQVRQSLMLYFKRCQSLVSPQ